MTDAAIDLLAVASGTVIAPAGCGKTHLIAQTLSRHSGSKPMLILTHTNSGVAALRGRLDKANVAASAYRLATIDGWAMRLIGLFPGRSEIEPVILKLANPKTDYPAIRNAAWRLLKAGHVLDILAASYARLIVDEYQDCSIRQHAIVYHTARVLPTCVLGDPMQAIFGWQGNERPDWDKHVCQHFRIVGELTTPWRWKNAGTENFGRWLLDVRRKLKDGTSVDLTSAPPEVTWVRLDGTEDRILQIRAGSIRTPTPDGTVLIVGKSTSPSSQQEFASQIPGAETVEAVELKDMVQFARDLDFQGVDALEKVASFAGSVMANVGAPDLIQRVGILERGKGRREPSDAERAALRFKAAPTPAAAVDLLVEISKTAGVKKHRPLVLRASIKALRSCDGSEGNTFLDAAIRAREQNRLLGRPLPKRAVGSTLLLKGLEADISVILDAADLDARNLYVAMTRGSRRLVVCSNTTILTRQAPPP